MSSIIYLGLSPKASQVVSAELQKRNILLLKAAPSDIKASVFIKEIIPGYAIYKHSLSAFIHAAETGLQQVIESPYYSFTNKNVPSFSSNPDVVFSFPTVLNAEVRDAIKAKYSAQDTVAKGRPALKAEMSIEEVIDLVTTEKPIQTTPATTTAINISAYRVLHLLRQLFDTVCRTHQYSGEPGTEGLSEIVEFDEHEAFNKVEHAAVGEEDAWTTFYLASNPRVIAHNNLAEEHGSFNYIWKSAKDVPAVAKGYTIPYVLDLAKPDYSTVLSVIDKYLKGSLGDSLDEADEVFDQILQSWSVIAITPWGMEVSHMYWCLGVALESGATLRVISNSAEAYGGCVLLGGGYLLKVNGKSIPQGDRETLVADFAKASPHDVALSTVFAKIFYPSAVDRQSALEGCNSLHDLRAILKKQGTSEGGREEIKRAAPFLVFESDKKPFAPTGFNISKVLEAIASDSAADETNFPLLPEMILSDNRLERLWSSFGSLAPSFRVPGGKLMKLDAPFEVTERAGKDNRAARTVKKLGFILKPLSEAIVDLQKVIDEKNILNPHGASLMSRSSSSALIKTLEADQCERVVAGLRSCAKVTVADAGAAKRKAGGGIEDARSIKKSRFAF